MPVFRGQRKVEAGSGKARIPISVEKRRFSADELRTLLVQRGMIQGNELITNMPKALAGDPRFAWDASGEYVTVNI